MLAPLNHANAARLPKVRHPDSFPATDFFFILPPQIVGLPLSLLPTLDFSYCYDFALSFPPQGLLVVPSPFFKALLVTFPYKGIPPSGIFFFSGIPFFFVGCFRVTSYQDIGAKRILWFFFFSLHHRFCLPCFLIEGLFKPSSRRQMTILAFPLFEGRDFFKGEVCLTPPFFPIHSNFFFSPWPLKPGRPPLF